MTDDEIRDELLVHLSKAALDSGPKAIDRIAGTVATVSGTLLAAYIAALGFLRPSYRDRQHLVLTATPVAIWLITLPVSLFLTLPRNVRVDLKQPGQIVEAGRASVRRQLIWARAVLFLMLAGIGLAAGIVLYLSALAVP